MPAPADSVRELCKSVQVYQDVMDYCNLAYFTGGVELGSRLFKNPEIQLHVIRAWFNWIVCRSQIMQDFTLKVVKLLRKFITEIKSNSFL